MTQAPVDPSFDPPVTGGPFVEPLEPPRWSAAAITGFVMSFLLVLAPLGIILGIVGLFRTRGGRRRGRALSIAAIPIGALVSTFTALVVIMSIVLFAAMGAGMDSMEIWRSSRVNIAAKASDLYDVLSPRFRVRVSPDAFQAWAAQVNAKHGALQDVRRADQFVTPADDDALVLNFTGEFVNGPANIAVTIGMNGWSPEIDNIEVDGVSALSEGTSASPATDTATSG